MHRLSTRILVAVVSIGSVMGADPALAQLPFSFKFREGSPLYYRTVHETKVEVKQGEESAATASTVKQLKKWDVKKIDALGVATIELSIQELALDNTDPSGETVKFDSTDLTGSNPQLVEQLKGVVGRPIIEIQIDNTGAIKGYKHLTARQDVLRDLPFMITVPNEKIPTVGTAWRRDFPIPLEPPLSTPARTLRGVQNCNVTASDSNKLVVDVESKLLDEVKTPKEMLPVVQFLPKGTIVLDPKGGRMLQAKMTIDQTINDFQGAGSTYKFFSQYSEDFVDNVQQADTRK
ncbi:hypothetical protein K2Y11_00870 [bacterium]|nr:hypothetical protein [bacterium]